MNRYHKELSIMRRRARISREIFGVTREQGIYRKRTLGCGKSACCVCHGDKFPVRIPTRQEIRAEEDLLGSGFDTALSMNLTPLPTRRGAGCPAADGWPANTSGGDQ